MMRVQPEDQHFQNEDQNPAILAAVHAVLRDRGESEKSRVDAGSGAALGKKGDLPPPTREKALGRLSGFQADKIRRQVQSLMSQGKLDKAPSVWGCGRTVIPETRHNKPTKTGGMVHIARYDRGEDEAPRHSLIGVQRCGSAFACPSCARKISSRRRNEIQIATQAMIDMGRTYIFTTFTARHTYEDRLKDFISAFQEAMRSMKQRRSYKLFKNRWNLDHCIRTAEVTLDHPDSVKKSGWHWHAHVVEFLDREPLTENEAATMQEELSIMWQSACSRFGLYTDAKIGVTIERPHYKIKGGKVYCDPSNIEKVANYLAKAVSFEAAPSPHTKSGNSDRITSMQLFGLAGLKGRNDCIPKLNEFIQDIKGRRSCYFSRGLKDLAGINEITDEEIVEGEEGDEIVYTFEEREWTIFASQGKARAGMYLIDDGVMPAYAVTAVSRGYVSKVIAEFYKLDFPAIGLEVIDQDTGEFLIEESQISAFLADGDLSAFEPPEVAEPTVGRLPLRLAS